MIVAPLSGARVDVGQGGIAANQVGQGTDHEARDDDQCDGCGEGETGRHRRVGACTPPGARRVRLDGVLDGLRGSGRHALRGSEAVERQADQEAGGESDQEEDEDRHRWGARGGRSPPEVSPGGRLEKPAA